MGRLLKFKECAYAHGAWHPSTDVVINLDDVSAVQQMRDEPLSMVRGYWMMCRVVLRCGREIMVDATPDDFLVEGYEVEREGDFVQWEEEEE